MSSVDPPLSYKDLISMLVRHGVLCSNPDERSLLERAVETIGYYRLEEYSWPFRKMDASDISRRSAYFKQKTRFSVIWNRYLFDRRMRLLLIDAIERFEVALRCGITQLLTSETGCNTPHADISLFPKMQAVDKKTGKTQHAKWLGTIQSKYSDTGTYDPRIEHCKVHHGITDVSRLPIWIVMEMTTFGDIKKLYEGLRPDLKARLAQGLGVNDDFLTSSLILLHQVRNRCAHHKRIWNYLWQKKRRFVKPLFMCKPASPVWYCQYDAVSGAWQGGAAPAPWSFAPKDTAFVIVLCGFWLDRIAQSSLWKERVERLVQPCGRLSNAAREAGFPDGWEKHPLWR